MSVEPVTIISDGNPYNTQILDAQGMPIKGCSKVEFSIEAGEWVTISLTMQDCNVKVTGVPKLILMRKWFGFRLRAVHPAHVASYLNAGWKIM